MKLKYDLEKDKRQAKVLAKRLFLAAVIFITGYYLILGFFLLLGQLGLFQ